MSLWEKQDTFITGRKACLHAAFHCCFLHTYLNMVFHYFIFQGIKCTLKHKLDRLELLYVVVGRQVNVTKSIAKLIVILVMMLSWQTKLSRKRLIHYLRLLSCHEHISCSLPIVRMWQMWCLLAGARSHLPGSHIAVTRLGGPHTSAHVLPPLSLLFILGHLYGMLWHFLLVSVCIIRRYTMLLSVVLLLRRCEANLLIRLLTQWNHNNKLQHERKSMLLWQHNAFAVELFSFLLFFWIT